jgi:8-oxo-dGTP pyrophosphatase MutT (NUDIX family)
MTTPPSTRSSTAHFQGRVISVTVDDVTLPNGRQALLEVVHHPGGAAIVAINDLEQMCLLRQYRYVAGGWVWELPAGKLEPAEPPELTARRELTEEAGVIASDWVSLGSLLSSPGVFAEVIHLYLARGLSAARTQLEDSEVIEVHWVSFRQACDMALSGELRDAKTIIGVLRAAHRLGMTLSPR